MTCFLSDTFPLEAAVPSQSSAPDQDQEVFGPRLPPTLPPPSSQTGQFVKRNHGHSMTPHTRVLVILLMLTAGSSASSACFLPPEKMLRKKSKEKKTKSKKQHKHKKEKVKSVARVSSAWLFCIWLTL